MQVTQLGAINTDDHDQLVARLVGVIGIDPETAIFYLEASDWNPHNAIQLHLQNNSSGRGTRKRRHRERPQYIRKEVEIAGISNGWAADIDPKTGRYRLQQAHL